MAFPPATKRASSTRSVKRSTPPISATCGAQLVGRITGNGRREFYFYAAEPGELDRVGRECHEGFRGLHIRDRQHFPARVGAVPQCCIPPRPISSACRTDVCSRRWRSRVTCTRFRARLIIGCTSAMKLRARPAARRWRRSNFAIEDEGMAEEDGGDMPLRAGGVARRQRGHAHHQRHHARAAAPGR